MKTQALSFLGSIFLEIISIKVIGASCLVLMSCSSVTQSPEPDSAKLAESAKVEDLSERSRDFKQELEIGREMAARLVGTFELVKDQPLAQEYVTLIGANLARFSGRPEVNYSFGILNVDEPNAYATPGGFIFVTRGLLKMVQSEEELAAVLAHEIAHVTEKHVYNSVKPETNVGSTLARAVGGGKSGLGAGLGKTIAAGMKILLEEGYGSEKESQADSVGSMFLVAAGYPPTSLEPLLLRMSKRNSDHAIAKTHPPFDSRLKSLQSFYKDQELNKLKSSSSQTAMAKRFQHFLKSIRSTK